MSRSITNVIIVHIGDVIAFPPVLNVARLLDSAGVDVCLISTRDHPEADYAASLPSGVSISLLSSPYSGKEPIVSKLLDVVRLKGELWRLIDASYSSKTTLIWVSADLSMKFLGREILRRNYVFHVMELAECLSYRLGHRFPAMDAEAIGNSSLAVIVPERTRAHITQAWWNLKDLPLVLPNKPVDNGSLERSQAISDYAARSVMDAVAGQKIVLYQGITHRERPLKPYLEAVELLGGEFVFATMGIEDPLENQVSDRYIHIPYVQAPRHLEVTSNAYIGVLSYFPFRGHLSPLNPLFCAPNKTFEYAKFGIPMLSNANPNLNYIFDIWGCGKTVSSFDAKAIAQAISAIDSNYLTMSAASRAYYDSVDMFALMGDILKTVEARLAERKR
ncbi:MULTISPECIES: glycosyltransferase family 4 protein [unclassified Adlercreutzia]|uniref:glycosyltransferase family 4 protein n=1 Tax=unclassified Adlercreutzia TaxID=2636013 RepID=UPI0013EBA85A|nr:MULTISPECIES: glycosyltransferase family 4 protein [unclassified Adlercreutzia]